VGTDPTAGGIAAGTITTQQLIAHAISLPTEERARVADTLLRSLNAPSDEVDEVWTEVAHRRLLDLRSGKAVGIEADEAFAFLRDRLGA